MSIRLSLVFFILTVALVLTVGSCDSSGENELGRPCDNFGDCDNYFCETSESPTIGMCVPG